MKFGFTDFSYPTCALNELADAANRFGYDCIELRVGYGHSHGIESGMPVSERVRCTDLLAAAEIELVCLGMNSSFTNPQTCRDEIRAARAVIELAGSLRTPIVRVFGGRVASEVPQPKALELVERALRDLAPFAEDKGVQVCIETHDGWTDPAAVAELLTRIDHPAAGVVWDVMHPFFVAQSSIQETFSLLRPWIRHVHAHDGIRETTGITRCPIGAGEVDHRQAIQLLRASGFQGCVSFEWEGCAPARWSGWNSPEVHLPQGLATLRGF